MGLRPRLRRRLQLRPRLRLRLQYYGGYACSGQGGLHVASYDGVACDIVQRRSSAAGARPRASDAGDGEDARNAAATAVEMDGEMFSVLTWREGWIQLDRVLSLVGDRGLSHMLRRLLAMRDEASDSVGSSSTDSAWTDFRVRD